jgi:putative SOS response-associated peptidase YedK
MPRPDRDGPDGEPVETCASQTTGANETVRSAHGRRPVILPPDTYEQWLDADAPLPAVKKLLCPYPGALESYAVGRWVNDPKHDDARCLEPAA